MRCPRTLTNLRRELAGLVGVGRPFNYGRDRPEACAFSGGRQNPSQAAKTHARWRQLNMITPFRTRR